jgi:hypothetical protein
VALWPSLASLISTAGCVSPVSYTFWSLNLMIPSPYDPFTFWSMYHLYLLVSSHPGIFAFWSLHLLVLSPSGPFTFWSFHILVPSPIGPCTTLYLLVSSPPGPCTFCRRVQLLTESVLYDFLPLALAAMAPPPSPQQNHHPGSLLRDEEKSAAKDRFRVRCWKCFIVTELVVGFLPSFLQGALASFLPSRGIGRTT